MKKSLRTAVVAALFAALATSVIPALAENTGHSFEGVRAGAKREGKLVVWVQLPAKPETHRAVVDAFNQRFGLNTQVDWVPTSPNNANPRIIAEASGGSQVSVDIVGGAIDEVVQLVGAGAVKPYPWTDVFESALPGMAGLEEQVDLEYRGDALPYLDVHYGLAWNPNFLKESELPAKFTDLLDEKWRGKFGLNSIFFVPLPIMAPTIGAEKTVELAKQIYANKPVLIRGTPAVAQSIVNGSIPLGVTIFTSAEAAARTGQPIGFRLFSDYIPISTVHLYIPENSPNPNTARLFAAWFATEGYKVADKYEPNPQAAYKVNKVTQMTDRAVAGGAKIVRVMSAQDLKEAARAREQIGLLISGQQ